MSHVQGSMTNGLLKTMRAIVVMLISTIMYGVACNQRSDPMQTFSIGSTLIELPDFLAARFEEDTLVAFPPQTDFVNLRFSVLSVTKGEQESTGAGERLIRNSAAAAGAELHEREGRVWYSTSEPASEGSQGSVMHYWHVGMGSKCLVVSCFVDSEYSDHALTKRVLESVEPAILSFRHERSSQ